MKEQDKTRPMNDIEAVKQHKRIKLKLFLFSVVRSALYIGTCTAIMIILDNKMELTKQFSWWIGWVMAVIYTNWGLKRR